jgi:ABC-type antimicrobial peptide transport system permease subunit
MRLGSRSVRTPSGEDWQVGRRWITRGLPRWRKVPAGRTTGEALSLPDIGGPEDLVISIAVILGAIVVAAILIPLLLFGIELILLGFAIAAAILGRGLLGRPWIVQARREGESTPKLAWQVSGWRGSARLIDEVATALAAGLDPAPAEAQDVLAQTAS